MTCRLWTGDTTNCSAKCKNTIPLKDHMEAVGHKESFDFVRELVQNQIPMSERIIQQIHYLVLAGKKKDRNVYCRIPVHIMGIQRLLQNSLFENLTFFLLGRMVLQKKPFATVSVLH